MQIHDKSSLNTVSTCTKMTEAESMNCLALEVKKLRTCTYHMAFWVQVFYMHICTIHTCVWHAILTMPLQQSINSTDQFLAD